jgi:hypothetical protein
MTKRKEKVATAADVAAINFQPLSANELADIKPPTADEWLQYLKMLRIGYRMLSRTKEQMKGVARVFDDLGEEGAKDFEKFAATISILKGYAAMLESAEMRLMSAAASLAEEVA